MNKSGRKISRKIVVIAGVAALLSIGVPVFAQPFAPPLAFDFGPSRASVARPKGLCHILISSLASLFGLETGDPYGELQTLIADVRPRTSSEGLRLGDAADTIFVKRGIRNYDTGRGFRQERDVDAIPYPVEVALLQAYLKTLEVPKRDLKQLPPEQLYVLSRVRQHLLDHPHVVEEVRATLRRPWIEIDGRPCVFFGPVDVRAFDPKVDMNPSVPEIKINAITHERGFVDGYGDVRRWEFRSGSGLVRPSQDAVIEDKAVRLVFWNSTDRVGFVDGTYIGFAALGAIRGDFRGSRSASPVQGHLLRLSSGPHPGEVVFVPEGRIEFFYRPD